MIIARNLGVKDPLAGTRASRFTRIERLACQPKPWRRQARARFTLIELLVSVAIIAILAALLLPGLARAKYRAQMLVCMNNEKQMGLGMTMQAGDFDGKPVLVMYDGRVQSTYYIHKQNVTRTWGYYVYDDRFNTYGIGMDILFCPLNRTDATSREGSINFPDDYSQKARAGYSLYPTTNVGPDTELKNLKKLQQLAGRALVADYCANHKPATTGGTHQALSKTHVLYADGHVNDVPLSIYYSYLRPTIGGGYNTLYRTMWDQLSNYEN